MSTNTIPVGTGTVRGARRVPAKKWLIRQQQLLLATPYFMVTFTLPEERCVP
jgi:hypothetical protein